MRAVILLNPKIPVEHWNQGKLYADASFGFDYNGSIDDQKALAAHLRELADMLEAPTLEDVELDIVKPGKERT